jgi:hypothetical protein
MKKEPKRWEKFEKTRKRSRLETLEVDLGKLDLSARCDASLDLDIPELDLSTALLFEGEIDIEEEDWIKKVVDTIRLKDEQETIKNIIINYETDHPKVFYKRMILEDKQLMGGFILEDRQYQCERRDPKETWTCYPMRVPKEGLPVPLRGTYLEPQEKERIHQYIKESHLL